MRNTATMPALGSRLVGMGVLLLSATSASCLLAGVTVEEHAEETDGLTVYRMTVTPAAEPQPALKVRLWQRPHLLKPGNAAMHYVRCSAENILNGAWSSARSQFGDAVNEWYDNSDFSIEELPLEQLRAASAIFDSLVEQFIRPGTESRDCDWGLGLEDMRGVEIIYLPLPEFQQARAIGRLLALRTRLAIAEGHYDDALDHLRMNYRLAHDVGSEKLLVCNLVGIAIQGIANQQAIDLIAAPDSPNLYWALAELPAPLVDCRQAIQLEMTLGARMFPVLLDAETVEHSDREWARLLAEGFKTLQEVLEEENMSDSFQLGHIADSRHGMWATGVSLLGYPHAMQRLIESGMPAEQVEAMSVGQVMLIDAAREYRRVADEHEKWWYVPYAEARLRMQESERALDADKSRIGLGRTIADMLLPSLRACRTAQARQLWQKNALLVVEALRMHAAATGEFPESLDQIVVVPVPDNPITEQPYLYRLVGDTAMLELPFSDGMPGIAWRFEIKLTQE